MAKALKTAPHVEQTRTPGPWAYDPADRAVFYDDGDVKPRIAIIDDNTSPEQSDADGRLIAAAPALLKSVGPSDGGTASFPDELDVIARIIDQHDAGSGLGRHLRDRATIIRSALAKVEG